MIIIIDNKEYAVGLNWFAISSPEEVEQFQREMDLNHGILKKATSVDETASVALCGPEYNGQVSLAGMLSFAYTNLIFVMATEYKDDNGQPLYYLCAIKNGAVTVDGDVVDTLDVIETLYNQNYSEITADLEPSEVDLFGSGVDENQFPLIQQVSPDHVLDRALRYASQATIGVLGKAGISKLSIAMLVILFLAGGYFVYDWFFSAPPPPPQPVARPQPTQPVEPQVDPREQFLTQFQSTLEKQPTPDTILTVVDGVKSLPMNFGGWILDDINFNGNNPDVLTLNLLRDTYGSVNQIFDRKDMGLFASVNMSQDGNEATVTYNLTGRQPMYIPIQRIDMLEETGSPVYYSLINTLQMYNIPFSADELTKNNYFSVGKVSFSGSGLWGMVDIHEILARFDTFSISSIQIETNNGQYNWKIEGNIYG